MVVLVDERPESHRHAAGSEGEVIASTFDRPAEDHHHGGRAGHRAGQAAGQLGEDVVVLLGSITRLGRAYNLAAPARWADPLRWRRLQRLVPAEALLRAARNIEHSGSLTIISTALVETGSRMDEVISRSSGHRQHGTPAAS